MPGPERADHTEADEERDQRRNQGGEGLQVLRIGSAVGKMRCVKLDHQQCDRNREHRIREEDQPFERMRRRSLAFRTRCVPPCRQHASP